MQTLSNLFPFLQTTFPLRGASLGGLQTIGSQNGGAAFQLPSASLSKSSMHDTTSAPFKKNPGLQVNLKVNVSAQYEA